MEIPILRTKLYIPQTQPRGLIARSRLTQRLNEGLAHKLILICAPAGSGKTTLVSQWHNERMKDEGGRRKAEGRKRKTSSLIPHPFKVAWLSLDEGDNDSVRFWTYVIAALETVHPDLGASLSLLHSPQPSPIEVVLTFLLNDLATLPYPLILVLDDYHLVENPKIHTELTFLLDHLPPRSTVLITSRADPPLPLARWRVKRQLAELRAEDLRFTPAEAALFFNQLMGLELSAEQVAALEVKTEGWIAGLQLAALSLQDRTDIENFIAAFTGNHRYILDYMTEEILHRQSDSVQTFLLQTAILERLSGPLCDAVTGRSDGQAVLEQLARANLFIIPLDDQGQWYRYHRLFADLLRHHLQQTARFPAPLGKGIKADVTELHRRAAAWYEQTGWIEEAIQHAIFAQDFERVGRLILHHAPMIIDRGGAALLLRWFKALPETWVQSRPKLGLLQAWLLFLTGHLEEVQRKLAALEITLGLPQAASPGLEADEGGNNDQVPGLLAGLQAQIALIKGDLPRAIALSQQALTYLMADEVGPPGVILGNLALAYWMNGEPEKAQGILSKLGAEGPSNSSPAALIALSHMAELKRMQGQDRHAFSLYQQLLQLTAEKEPLALSPIAGLAHTEVGHLLYEWNDLAGAEAHLRQGIKLGNQGAGFRPLMLGYIGLFWVRLAQENFDEAAAIIQQVEQLTAKMGADHLAEMTTHMWADLWLARRDFEALAQWIQASKLTVEDEFDNRSVFTYTVFAQVLLAQGELSAATSLLARLLVFWESVKQTHKVIEILALQALTFQAQQNLDQALATLQRALILAEPEGYIRTFIDNGPPMAALLKRIKAEGGGMKAYIHKLLTTFEQDEGEKRKGEKEKLHPSVLIPQPLIDPLTKRELEVLQLLTTGLSGSEIADKLVIARTTLKSHLRNIYNKLGVGSRAQAIVKAKELNLF